MRNLAPGRPLWVMEERETAMQIDRMFLDCTAFLGVPVEHGFCAEGTGFFVRIDLDGLGFDYIVTCRHVVRPFASLRDATPNDAPIWIRINRKTKLPFLFKTRRCDWICHENRGIDVCVYPFDEESVEEPNELQFATLTESIILTPQREKRFGLSLGDEIFIAGCFVGRVGEKKNIPVIRLASIAAMPDEPVWGGSPSRPAYLIETRSLGGVSGSPFFLHLYPDRISGRRPLGSDGKGGIIAPYFLVGMMQGLHSGQYAGEFIGKDDDETIVPKDADFNAGIAIGIPVAQIMEVIYRPDLVEARMATVRAKQAASGYKPAAAQPQMDIASSVPSVPPDGDAT